MIDEPFTPGRHRDRDCFFHHRIACPRCNAPLDCATDLVRPDGIEGGPHDGAFTICMECAEPMAYAVNPLGQISLRALTDHEWAEFTKIPQFMDSLADIRRTVTITKTRKTAPWN